MEPVQRTNPQHGGKPRRRANADQNGAEAIAPSSKDELREVAGGVVGEGPSGFRYKLLPPLLERHALAGKFPARLRQLAAGGQEEIARIFALDDEAEFAAESEGLIDYFDELVLLTVVEPSFERDELPGRENALMPAADYRWILSVAMGESIHDARGISLWPKGRPLSERFQEALSRR